MGSAPRKLLLLSVAVIAMFVPSAATAAGSSGDPTAHRLVAGLEGGSGSTIGPDGALYVTESAAGRVTRVDPRTGATTTFASGLPELIPAAGFGGPVDVAFLGRTAYVLVTLVGPDVGGSDVVGIYRVDGPDRFSVVADIGAFSIANPPATSFFVPSGVQYALQAYRGGLLVTDGHHNRVLRVTRGGQITELRASATSSPPDWRCGAGPSSWPKPAPPRICLRTARWWRSGPGRPPSGTWRLAAACWLMWSSAAGTGCTPSPRASSARKP